MKPAYKNLGKVCLTPAGDWTRANNYKRIDVVTHPITGRSYIAKKDVPAGVSIENQEYWQPIGSGGYRDNNIIILSDIDLNTNELVRYTLETAIATINTEDKRPGLILGFYGTNPSNQDGGAEWFLYQFNSDTIDDWNKLECWISIYDNIDKFKGYFLNECLLINNVPHPEVGDYAFVGESMDNAILYVCVENGNWKNTQTSAFAFANKYKAIYSRDAGEFETHLDETYADRATKDALGNIIHDTYITRSGLHNAIIKEVINQINNLDIPDGSIVWDDLSESIKQMFSSGGNITNFPDEEDLTVKDNKLKFANREYKEGKFTGYGYVILRRNMTDDINLLEQSMINTPNTVYVIRYDYCLNDKEITIPENCILLFEGGSINRGTINLNNVYVKDIFGVLDEFNNIIFNGDFRTGQLRYNKDTAVYEVYKNNKWNAL